MDAGVFGPAFKIRVIPTRWVKPRSIYVDVSHACAVCGASRIQAAGLVPDLLVCLPNLLT